MANRRNITTVIVILIQTENKNLIIEYVDFN